jgi:hypothetical protein
MGEACSTYNKEDCKQGFGVETGREYLENPDEDERIMLI